MGRRHAEYALQHANPDSREYSKASYTHDNGFDLSEKHVTGRRLAGKPHTSLSPAKAAGDRAARGSRLEKWDGNLPVFVLCFPGGYRLRIERNRLGYRPYMHVARRFVRRQRISATYLGHFWRSATRQFDCRTLTSRRWTFDRQCPNIENNTSGCWPGDIEFGRDTKAADRIWQNGQE